MKMSTVSTALAAVGLAAVLAAPAIAQTGSPNATGSKEINQNQPPKGNIGTSSQDPAGPSRGTTSGSGMGAGSGSATPGSANAPPNAEVNIILPPKGNIGTSSQSPGGPSR